MEVQYLFNSKGDWIAFRKGKHLFAPRGDWLGWFPWGDDVAVDTYGEYLGTVYLGKRLYRFDDPKYRGYPGSTPSPGNPGYPGSPGQEDEGWLPAAAEDVRMEVAW